MHLESLVLHEREVNCYVIFLIILALRQLFKLPAPSKMSIQFLPAQLVIFLNVLFIFSLFLRKHFPDGKTYFSLVSIVGVLAPLFTTSDDFKSILWGHWYLYFRFGMSFKPILWGH